MDHIAHPGSPKDVEDNKFIAALSYVWVLFLLPLLLKKNSPYAQFHGKQGLLVFIAWIVNMVISMIPILGWIVGFFGFIALLLTSIIGFVKALQGEWWELPFLGKYKDQIKL